MITRAAARNSRLGTGAGICLWTLLLVCAEPGAAQTSDADPNSAVLVPQSGFKISEVAAYAGGYSFGSTPGASDSGSGGLLAAGGISTDLEWDLNGPESRFSVRYRGGYNGNQRLSQSNGIDNTLDVGWRWTPSERWTVLADLSADSVVFGGFLFSAPAIMDSAENLDAALGATNAAAAPTGIAAASSPLTYALFGARRRDLSASAAMAYRQSERLSWKYGINTRRSLPITARGADFSDSPTLPSVTDSELGGGLEYLLTQRDSIGADAGFEDTVSGYARSRILTGGVSWEHLLSREWFVRGELGAGELNELVVGGRRTNGTAYRGGVGVGWKRSRDTLSLTVRRDVGDSEGFGSSSNQGIDVAEIYHAPGSQWRVEASAGYERLSGGALGGLSGWLTQVTVYRQLAPRLRWSTQFIYGSAAIAPSESSSTESLVATARRGVRVSFEFTPEARIAR